MNKLIQVFRKSGPAILDALPALVERLSDDNNRVRGLAAIALGEVGPPAGAATPALTRALADEFSNVREAAAEALTKIGSGEAAIPDQGLKTPK